MKTTADRPRVLVVDDNKDAATTLGTLLEFAGYEVRTCFAGKDALRAADQFDPDACVLDINMPEMDGYELAQRLRAKYPDDPPLLATMTAYDDYTHLERSVDAGFDLHFTKSAQPTELLDQLGDHMRKRSGERVPLNAQDGRVSARERSDIRPSAARNGFATWWSIAGALIAAFALLFLWKAQ
jgi:CheY-like chemotaxis protein